MCNPLVCYNYVVCIFVLPVVPYLYSCLTSCVSTYLCLYVCSMTRFCLARIKLIFDFCFPVFPKCDASKMFKHSSCPYYFRMSMGVTIGVPSRPTVTVGTAPGPSLAGPADVSASHSPTTSDAAIVPTKLQTVAAPPQVDIAVAPPDEPVGQVALLKAPQQIADQGGLFLRSKGITFNNPFQSLHQLYGVLIIKGHWQWFCVSVVDKRLAICCSAQNNTMICAPCVELRSKVSYGLINV